MKTYVTINNDQSIVYFTGEDADADICIKTSSLYINRTILKLCKSVQDGVVTQFMLHHVLNLQYCDGKSNYFMFLESVKDNCALTTFLQKYSTG